MIDWFEEAKKEQIVLEEVSRNESEVTFVKEGNIVILDLSKTISTHPYKAHVNDPQLMRLIKDKTVRVESSQSKGAAKRKLYITAIS